MNVRYVELADYLAIAAEITELDTNALIRVTKVALAESTLHAQQLALARLSSTPTSSTRPPFSSYASRRTTRSLTAISEQHG